MEVTSPGSSSSSYPLLSAGTRGVDTSYTKSFGSKSTEAIYKTSKMLLEVAVDDGEPAPAPAPADDPPLPSFWASRFSSA